MTKFFKKYIAFTIISILVFIFGILYIKNIYQSGEVNPLVENPDKEEILELSRIEETNILVTKNVNTQNTNQNRIQEISDNTKNEISGPQITLIAGGLNKKLFINPGENLYEIFISNKIDFEGKEYPALGFFVTKIGGMHGERGEYLIYYINGKEATVGVSSYVPKEGDVITWELK